MYNMDMDRTIQLKASNVKIVPAEQFPVAFKN